MNEIVSVPPCTHGVLPPGCKVCHQRPSPLGLALSLLAKLKAAEVVVVDAERWHGDPQERVLSDGSDGYRQAVVTADELALFESLEGP